MKKLVLTLMLIFNANYSPATSVMPNSITINFISIGSGIDHQADDAIKEIIKREITLGNINQFKRYSSMGFEGERSYCIEIGKFNDPKHTFTIYQEMEETLTRPGLTTLNLGIGCK